MCRRRARPSRPRRRPAYRCPSSSSGSSPPWPREKAADTFTDYERWCREFAKLVGNCSAAALTRADALAFRQHLLTATWKPPKGRPRKYKPKTVNNALIAARRLFNWAGDAGLVAVTAPGLARPAR